MWVVVLWLERLRSTFFHPLLASQACWWEDRDEPHWDMKLIGSHQSYASLEETFLLQRSCPSCKNANMFTYVDLLNSLSGFAFALEGEFLCNDQSPQRVRRERVIEDNWGHDQGHNSRTCPPMHCLHGSWTIKGNGWTGCRRINST